MHKIHFNISQEFFSYIDEVDIPWESDDSYAITLRKKIEAAKLQHESEQS